MNKMVVCVPFTGLGLYGGFRGNRWLRNRIEVFKKFVVPSLLNQTDQDFIVWVAWRKEEKTNKYVIELEEYLQSFPFKVVFTYSGIPFWDDKYPDDVALDRLTSTLKGALPTLMEAVGDCEHVLWLLQPSDDCYDKITIEAMKEGFKKNEVQAIGFERGYLCNYSTKEVLEYNPKTNPPFFCIKFPRNIFFDPGKHVNYTGPYKSHEYVGDKLRLAHIRERGFLVGTHGENISTHFNHPYGGARVGEEIFDRFGIRESPPLKLPISTRKWLMRKLPHQWQRKLRYWFGEKLYAKFYNFIRS